MMGGPFLSNAARAATDEVSALNERGHFTAVRIAHEHPLTIYLDKRELVTLMTLGAAPEELVLGYLRNQRLLASIDEVQAVQVDWSTGSAAVTSVSMALAGETIWDSAADGAQRAARLAQRTVTSGCGQGTMFGSLMDNVDRIRLPDTARLSREMLFSIVDQMKDLQSIYRLAGSVHGCGLFANAGSPTGRMLRFVEDVGRHNAVDAIAGWMWLNDVAGTDKIFYTTGRLTSEMVIKCAQIGVPFLVSRSGTTRMGYDIAQRVGITLISRCKGRHYLVLTGTHRVTDAAGEAVLG